MIELDVDMPDRPGELGKVLHILSEEHVNIDAMSANSGGGRSYISLITDQPIKARQALAKAGYECTQRTVLIVSLADHPGALAALARKLGAAGVNIESIIHLGPMGDQVQLALGLDNLDAARSLV
jgi:hypothetical protein